LSNFFVEVDYVKC